MVIIFKCKPKHYTISIRKARANRIDKNDKAKKHAITEKCHLKIVFVII